MKAVSKEYRESMQAAFRNASHAIVAFGNIDTSAATDGRWTVNNSASFSELSTLDYDFEYKQSCATLELNFWALDGNSRILPTSTANDGYVSSTLSDSTGNVTTQTVLSRVFNKDHTFPGITLVFDSRRLSSPTNIVVEFWNNGTAIEEVAQQVTGSQAVINTTAKEVDKLVVKLLKALPYSRFRVERTIYGIMEHYTNRDIVTLEQSNDVDPLSRRLPSKSLKFTVYDYEHKYDPDNPNGVYSYVDTYAPIKVQLGYDTSEGHTEWLKPDSYVLAGKPTTKNGKATFTATGLVESLSGLFYKSKLGTKNFYDMAEEVLIDANLTPSSQGTNPWVIDPSLKQITTNAVLPIASHMNCLQQIAHAGRCCLYTDNENVIHIKPFGVTVKGIYSGKWTDNGHAWPSEVDTLDRGNTKESTYATLELNRWVLDGSDQEFLQAGESAQRGFISNNISSDSGAYSVTPVLAKTFDFPHELKVLSIRFSSILVDYPQSIRIEYLNGSSITSTKAINSIDNSTITVYNDTADSCTGFRIIVLSNLPYYRVRIEKVFYRDSSFTLNFSTIKKDSQEITKIDQLKAVSVTKYSYTESEVSTLYDEDVTDTTLHLEFDNVARNVQFNVTNGYVVSSAVYARALDVTISNGSTHLVITGQPLQETSLVYNYPVQATGEVDVEENHLITSSSEAKKLAEHTKAYLQMRNTYTANYRGNPEVEVGDTVGLQTAYTDEIDALVLVSNITFNGALKGKMVVKGLI